MISTNLQGVAEFVVRRAQRQGYVVPREVREELAQAGVSESLWKDVLALARPSLSYRRGRYYYRAPISARVREEQSQQRHIGRAVRRLMRPQRGATPVERREEDRVEFVQTVQVTTQDGRVLTLLSRDLSATGIRLVGTHRLLGQKVEVVIPGPDRKPVTFLVRILWTCPVGEDLVENGGTFLGVVGGAARPSEED
ncbi:MAG TPA: PilZ domain-containing protein [Gemmataceae bacterium]|jgi:hypothetical protein|nr:PilZ domain-containing protein [Gemmataceae bacterium]